MSHPRLLGIARWMQRVLDTLLWLMLAVMTASIVFQVVGRYARDELEVLLALAGLGLSTAWTDEVARFLMAWVTMLGSAAVMRSEGHIEITVLTDRLTPRVRRFADLLRDVVIITLMGWVGFLGVFYVQLGQAESSMALEIPMAWPYAAIPIGAVLIAVMHVLARLAPEPTTAGGGERLP